MKTTNPMKAQHTAAKLPGQLELIRLDGYYSAINADGKPVQMYTDTPLCAEIVHRYNCHADLLEACKASTEKLMSLIATVKFHDNEKKNFLLSAEQWRVIEEAWNVAHEAHAKATAQAGGE